MSNDYFTSTSALQDFTRARGSQINNLSAQVQASFDLVPSRSIFRRVTQPTVTASGTASAIVVNNETPITAYAMGQRVSFKAIATNTGATTINVDGLGAKSILRADGTALAAGDITSGRILDLVYDGTQFTIVGTIVTINAAGTDVVIAAATTAATNASNSATAAAASAAAAAASIAPYTASDVLAKLLTVDGNGSGLDADKLRGTTPTTTGLALVGAASAAAAKGTLSLDNVNNTADVDKPVSTAQQAALDLKLPKTDPTVLGTGLTLPGDPVSDLHAASKGWVVSQISGLTNLVTKTEVVVKTTANITLSGEQTIDGVLTSASRVLVGSQTAPAENGIYVSAAGAWSRATDADTWAELPNAAVWVTSGTAGANKRWQCTVAAGGTLGTTAVTWAQISAASSYTASGGITKTGSDFALSTMAASTIKGNNTAGTAAPIDLNATQVTAMLNTFGASKGLVPGVASATNKYLQADANWVSALTPASVAASGTVTGSNLSGTNTGDQTITLTGDVTGSGTGSFAATIANKAVTLAKMADMATASFIGRNTAATGVPEVLSAATVKTMLDLSGTNTGDQTSVSGNAGTATALQTARTIAISTGATGTATSFDGTANITIPITGLNMSFATAGTLGVNRGGTGTTTSTGTGSVVLSAGPTLTGTLTGADATFSGVVKLADGTVTAPSLTFTNDTNTGLYSYAADKLGFAAGGIAAGNLDSTGLLTLAAGVQGAAGSATAPVFSFTGDTNTGVYSIGADQLGITTGGTLRVTVSTTGVTSTLPILAPAGSAGAPSISLSGDTDTGIYSLGANTLNVTCGGVSIAGFSTTGIDVAGEVRGDSIRIDATPTASGATTTHKLAINLNGSTYYLLLSNV